MFPAFNCWAHCGHMTGEHSKCAQLLIAGHIVIKWCLLSQCIHHVPAGYLPPCPQCQRSLNVQGGRVEFVP